MRDLMCLGVLIGLLASPALAAATSSVKLESVSFFYKADAEARYLEKKTAWQADKRQAASLEVKETLAREANQEASVEKPLDSWRAQGGAHPWVIAAKAQVYNPSSKAFLRIPVTVTLRAKTGELRVDPQLLVTHYGHLHQTAQWKPLLQYTTIIPLLGPQETILLPVASFEVLRFLRFHPNQWPEALQVEVQVTSPAGKRLKGTSTLALMPDHFVVPEYFP